MPLDALVAYQPRKMPIQARSTVTKGIHNFNENEMARLHKAAEEVKAIVESANDRQERSMMARNQFRQIGGAR